MDRELLDKFKALNKNRRVIRKASDIASPTKISTGSLTLDKALGGGWPSGRISLLWGDKSSTKSTMCMKAVANAQAAGVKCLYIDTEITFDKEWAVKMGVDVENLPVEQSPRASVIENVLKEYLEDGTVKFVVIDSISTIFPDNFYDDDSRQIGQGARAIKNILSKILDVMDDDVWVLLVSQPTLEMGSNYSGWMPTGGKSPQMLASVICRLTASPGMAIKDKVASGDKTITTTVGTEVKWQLTKSKISDSPPWADGIYEFYYGKGIDSRKELIQLGIEEGVIKQGGKWYTFGEEKWDGGKAFIDALEDADLYDKIRDEIFKGTE